MQIERKKTLNKGEFKVRGTEDETKIWLIRKFAIYEKRQQTHKTVVPKREAGIYVKQELSQMEKMKKNFD